jgi:hypothetical protein
VASMKLEFLVPSMSTLYTRIALGHAIMTVRIARSLFVFEDASLLARGDVLLELN